MMRRLFSTLVLVAGCGDTSPISVNDAGNLPEPRADAGSGDAATETDDPPRFDGGPEPEPAPDAGAPSPVPMRMLLADEGNAAVHFVALDNPALNWTYRVDVQDACCNLIRDMQLVGDGLVMVSRPFGFVELDLNDRGRVRREVTLAPVPGGIEAVRRTTDGHTIAAGNGGGGIFVVEFDEAGQRVAEHDELFVGLDNLRGMRLTERGTFLFASDTAASKAVHEGTWEGTTTKLFEIPGEIAAGHMTKAVFTGPDELLLSTGYGASLLRIDTRSQTLTKLIGGPDQGRPAGAERDLSPHFFAGFQLFPNGDVLVANWIDHGRGHNGEGYQLLRYDQDGNLVWFLDQRQFPAISSLHNVLVLDGLDLMRLHDDRTGLLEPR